MLIIPFWIGHSSFLIRSYKASDFGFALHPLGEHAPQTRRLLFYSSLIVILIRNFVYPLNRKFVLLPTHNFTIERRQRFFWLNGIPFFPLKKYWCIHIEGDKNEYRIPTSFIKTLQENKTKHRTPFLSYLLSTLIVVSALVIFVPPFVGYINMRRESNKMSKRVNDEVRTKIFSKLNNPQKGDCYIFDVGIVGESGFYPIVLRLDESTNDSVKLSLSKQTFFNYSGNYSNIRWKMDSLYNDSTVILKSCWIAKKELMEISGDVICGDYHDAAPLKCFHERNEWFLLEILHKGESP